MRYESEGIPVEGAVVVGLVVVGLVVVGLVVEGFVVVGLVVVGLVVVGLVVVGFVVTGLVVVGLAVVFAAAALVDVLDAADAAAELSADAFFAVEVEDFCFDEEVSFVPDSFSGAVLAAAEEDSGSRVCVSDGDKVSSSGRLS